ncbi:hypothetical protein HCH_03179 [Hahella chejuensis KCTC 2396]|uniref:Uncharacterized protein n=1 Tax=Hahella chejuensis (strain KCTC 2396) TaxID=349521 RepID=Q2SHD2_HAHCH|nr:hypothetical protein HCH_03179 [Hahella chejuensis KCTC 2396]
MATWACKRAVSLSLGKQAFKYNRHTFPVQDEPENPIRASEFFYALIRTLRMTLAPHRGAIARFR